jgi:hypothetical protein
VLAAKPAAGESKQRAALALCIQNLDLQSPCAPAQGYITTIIFDENRALHGSR